MVRILKIPRLQVKIPQENQSASLHKVTWRTSVPDKVMGSRSQKEDKSRSESSQDRPLSEVKIMHKEIRTERERDTHS